MIFVPQSSARSSACFFGSAVLTPLLILLVFLSGSVPAQEKKPKITVLNKERVYFPTILKKGTTYSKPAILVSSTVYDAIPEWQLIKRKGLTRGSAEYDLLLLTATRKFKKALRTVSARGTVDIIAEKGFIKCENCKVVDITQRVLRALPGKK